jgi:nucleoside-diphosphate kinase
MEYALCIIKPDIAADRRCVTVVFRRLSMIDLVPVVLRRVMISRAQAENLYQEHVGRLYHATNIDFMTSGPSVVMVLERDEACSRLRELIGETDPEQARPGTLRAMFGTELPRNAVHGSATIFDAEREIAIFFPKNF